MVRAPLGALILSPLPAALQTDRGPPAHPGTTVAAAGDTELKVAEGLTGVSDGMKFPRFGAISYSH